MAPTLSLLVLRCTDIEQSRRFYESLGLKFVAEKHGRGPDHFSTSLDGTVLELYPARERFTSGARLGLRAVVSESWLEEAVAAGGRLVRPKAAADIARQVVLEDPDGHTIDFEIANGEVLRAL